MALGRERRHDLDIARAFAMMGVVLIHVTTYFGLNYEYPHFDTDAVGRFCWGVPRLFVLPVFMFAAGVSASFSRKPTSILAEYGRFQYRKFSRLMLPFFSASIITMIVKLAAPGYGPAAVFDSLVGMLVAPRTGPAPHLWFLYTLMLMFLVWPFLRRLLEMVGTLPVMAVLLLIAFLPIPLPEVLPGRTYLSLGDIKWWLPVFTLGYWYGSHPIGRRQYGVGAVVGAMAVIAGTMALRSVTPWPGAIWGNYYEVRLFTSEAVANLNHGYVWAVVENALRWTGLLAGGLALIWLCGSLARFGGRWRLGLDWFGHYSYDVYLLHVALVGHPLAYLISRVLPPGPVLTYLAYAVVFLVTLLIPIGLGWLIRRSTTLALVILGVPRPRLSSSSPVNCAR